MTLDEIIEFTQDTNEERKVFCKEKKRCVSSECVIEKMRHNGYAGYSCSVIYTLLKLDMMDRVKEVEDSFAAVCKKYDYCARCPVNRALNLYNLKNIKCGILYTLLYLNDMIELLGEV